MDCPKIRCLLTRRREVSAPDRLAKVGDLWSGILAAKRDLDALLGESK